MPKANAVTKLRAQNLKAKTDLVRRIKRAQVDVGERIRKAAANKNLAKAGFREHFFGQIDSTYGLLGSELDVWGKQLVGRVATQWHGQAVDDIRTLGGKVNTSVVKFSRKRVKRYWELVHPDNAQNLAATFTNNMTRQDIQNLRTATVDVTRQRVLEGWNQNTFQKKLQERWNELAGNLASDRFVDSSGRRWSNANYLSMLSRTLTARVARESYMDTIVDHGDDLVRIGPSGDSCQICQRWIGLIISISGANPRFPSYQDALNAGMFHPNCDCLLTRVDPTVHAEDIARQSAQKNPKDWNDPNQVEGYKTEFMGKDPLDTDKRFFALDNEEKKAIGVTTRNPRMRNPTTAAAKKRVQKEQTPEPDTLEESRERLAAMRLRNAELADELAAKKERIANAKVKLKEDQDKVRSLNKLKRQIAASEKKTAAIEKRLAREDRRKNP